MNYIGDSYFPAVQHVALMQQSFASSQERLVKTYRADALSVYAQLPLAIPHALKRSLQDAAWETNIVQDFYVQPVALAQGACMTDLRDFVQKYPELAQRYVRSQEQEQTQTVFALLEASFNRAAVLYIPAGFTCDEPFELHRLLGSYRQQLLLEKIIIIVGEGARVVIEDMLDSPFGNIYIRSVEYYIGPRADVLVRYTQNLPAQAHTISRTIFLCERESSLSYSALLYGAQTAHEWVDCYLRGEHAQATLKGAYVQRNDQAYTITTHQYHKAAQTVSDLMFKGVLHDRATMNYTGDIYVDPAGAKTVAAQNNNTLLLSPRAHVSSKPRLQVLTNDVQCNHGSAMGQVDKEQLLYLQTRGLTESQAQALLLRAFLAEVIESGEGLERVMQLF